MAVLPFQPTPFFAQKNRAFWNLQFAGWGGAFLLRAVSGLVNGQDGAFFVIILIETVTGFSISTVLSAVYGQLINRRPLIAWGVSGLFLIVSVLAFAFIGAWVFSLTRGDPEAGFTAQLIGYLIYPLTLLGSWSALYYAINLFLQVEEQADQLEHLEAQATSAQLAMLRYQLNPHFLFNTLNSISTLVLLKQTEPANAMLTRLSAFLRHTLVVQPGGKVTLAQEVDTLKLYLGIEKMRFEDRLRTQFDIEDTACKARLPSMLLQPLIENAIKYAVSPLEEGARITLKAKRAGQRLRIVVSDTGPGLPGGNSASKSALLDLPPSAVAKTSGISNPADTRAASTGVGLANIRDRLAQAYGEEHLFEIRTPADGGFSVVIEIPFDTETPEVELASIASPATAPLLPPATTRHALGQSIGN